MQRANVSLNETKKPFKREICHKKCAQNVNLNKHIATVHEGKKPFKCEICGLRSSQNVKLNNYIASVHEKKCSPLDHEGKKPFKCENCNNNGYQTVNLKQHTGTDHERKKPFKWQIGDQKSGQNVNLNKHIESVHEAYQKDKVKQHISTVHEGRKPLRSLRISSLNICRGLETKEEVLKHSIMNQNCDICSVSEVDIDDFDEKRPFSIEGYNTFFPLERPCTNKKRLLCFVKVSIDVLQRNDLMSNIVSNVWLEIKEKGQKILICAIYCQFYDLTIDGKLTIEQQLQRLQILHSVPE